MKEIILKNGNIFHITEEGDESYSPVNEIRNLIKLLTMASESYYNSGDTLIDDKEYDILFDRLKTLENETGIIISGSPTQNVGAKILTELKEVKHNHLMLSLDKCHSADEVIKFSQGKDLIAMTKADGLTVSIKYENGKLISAETRGNGESGSDITEHIKHFFNVPLSINHTGTYIIDGEAIITNKDFEIVNSDGVYANSRNLASGTLSVLDTSLVSDRRLKFVAWDVIDGDDSNSLYIRLNNAYKLGFTVVPRVKVSACKEHIENAIKTIKEVTNDFSIPMDGIVFKFIDIEYGKSLGATGHHFKNGIAYKFEDETVESALKSIEWTLGKTGIITPVAIFEPVEIDGTMVERASLHNLSVLNQILGKPYYGQKVNVYKANMIIPCISSAERISDLFE